MKTIKIPEDLHRMLKVKGAEQGKGLQEVVEDALRLGLGMVSLQAQGRAQEEKNNRE